jgi:hypothetical protein
MKEIARYHIGVYISLPPLAHGYLFDILPRFVMM